MLPLVSIEVSIQLPLPTLPRGPAPGVTARSERPRMRPNHCFYKLKRTTKNMRVAILQPGAFLDQKSASILQQTVIFTHSNARREICGVAILQPGAFLDQTLASILQPGAFLDQQSAARSRSVKKSSTISLLSGTSYR